MTQVIQAVVPIMMIVSFIFILIGMVEQKAPSWRLELARGLTCLATAVLSGIWAIVGNDWSGALFALIWFFVAVYFFASLSQRVPG